MGQIDLFKNCSYLIGLSKKKKNTHKKWKYEHTMNKIPLLLSIKQL